ncbi:MAG: glycosyltransferase family 39 protein [Candidatus Woesebacteria bacterium]|nr:MAG: glycosyltransferase family 39 protein [Candidatus Woesebacteria bacterium]
MKKTITQFIHNHSLATLSVIYFLSRIVNLTKLPIFNDEAIYLDWGWKSLYTSAGLFYSLYDAKPPLLIWIFGVFENIFNSPLLAGRIVSVMFGFLTLAGIYKIAKNLGDERLARLSSIVYIIVPLFAFFDRQALMESAIAGCGIWSFYFLLRILETKKTKYAVCLGLILGIGIFIKLSAFVFLISVSLILIYKKHFKEFALSAISSLIIVSPLFFQKIFWTSLNTNNRFMLSIPELLSFPFSLWIRNFSTAVNISFFYLTPFVFILSICGIYFLLKRKDRILPTFFLTGFILVLFSGKSLNPRYLSAFFPLISVFCAYTLFNFRKAHAILIGSVSTIPTIMITYLLVISPITYFNVMDKMTVFSQKSEYLTGWTSGYGIPEVVDYLNQKGKDKKIIAGVRIDAGNPESAVFAYFNNSAWVKPTYIDSRNLDRSVLNLSCLTSPIPVYFVARDGNLAGLDKFFVEEKRYYKPENISYISISALKACD